MSKMDEFKKFVGKNPFLKDKINKKETTWQELYEHYDLYGEEDEIFKKPDDLNEETTESKDNNEESEKETGLNGLFDMLSGIDIDKIADGLNGMKKVLSILGELTSSQDTRNMNEKKAKPYSRGDD